MDPMFWIVMGGLGLASGGLAWLGLQRVAAPPVLPAPDRRGFLAVAARRGLQAELLGPVDRWTLGGSCQGWQVEARVVEVEGERWTEVRVRLPGVPAGLRVASRADEARGAVATGFPDADAALAARGEVAALGELWADPTRRAAWIEVLQPAFGPAVDGGWLVHADLGAQGERLEALLDRLLAAAARMVGPG
ncbi:hypothetical protein L6R53_17545 [Myxococcota bacterium]|nr:hypothetical protein [Myxococcota bacterium]